MALDDKDKEWIREQLKASEARILVSFRSAFDNSEAKSRWMNFTEQGRVDMLLDVRMRALEERLKLLEQRLSGRAQ